MPRALYELFEFAYSIIAYVRLEAACRRVRPHVLYERANLFLPAGVWLKRRRRVPMLLEVNAPLFRERERSDGIALKRLARWSEEMTWRAADCVLPVSGALTELVERAGVPRQRIAVVPNGVDAEQFLHGRMHADEAKRRLGLTNKLVLGFVGFVRDWHGLGGVIDILAEIGQERGVHLLVVGDGPARASLEQGARDRGVQSLVRFVGTVRHDDVPAYVSAFDIALQPGTTPYASPLKLVEYMALARAIVAPDTANIRELLVHDVTALLFDPALPGALRSAIERGCADPQLRTRLGAAARQAVIERGLTWGENARRIVAVARTLQSPPRPLQQGLGDCK